MTRSFLAAALLCLSSCSGTETRTETQVVTVPAPDETAPLVLLGSPSAGTTSVPLNAKVSVVFSETMDAGSLNASTLTLVGPGGAVGGAVSVGGDARVATFSPTAPLDPGASYTAQVTTGALDAAGNALAATVAWTFTTGAAADVAPPTVSGWSPASGALAAASGTPAVTVTFSEAVDCTSLPAGAIAVFEDGLPVAGYLDCAGATLSFVPVPALPTQTSLFAVVSPLVSDLAGNAVGAAHTWSFDVRPWTRQLGTTSADSAKAVAIDAAGNVYVAGETAGAMDGLSAGGADLFLAKFAPTGALLWVRQLGSAGEETVSAVATDAAGAIYAAGSTTGGLDGNVSGGAADLFVVKYDSSGVKQWTHQRGGSTSETARALGVDAAGDVYVAGETDGAFDGGTFAGGADAFLVKLDSAGAWQWTRLRGGGGYDRVYAGAVDADGNAYVVGYLNTTFDGTSSAGFDDIYVVKFNSAGTWIWTRQCGSPGYDNALSAATDSAGNVFIGGMVRGSFDGQPLSGSTDAVIVKYAPNGSKLWSRQVGTASDEQGTGVATDSAGNAYLLGITWGRFNGSPPSGFGELFVVKHDPSGSQLWVRQLSAATPVSVAAAATDPAGELFVAGSITGALDGNPSIGSADAFVVKYDGDGRKR